MYRRHRLEALVLSVKSMGAHILPICILYIRCPALVTALDRTVICKLEYSPVLCTQILVSLGSTINTETQQTVSINLAGEVKEQNVRLDLLNFITLLLYGRGIVD